MAPPMKGISMLTIRVITTFLFMNFLCSGISADSKPTQLSLRNDPEVESALRLIATWLDAERAYKQIPGLSVSVVHDQDIVWSDGFGNANREQQVKATAKTIYSICSISKLFTSIGVMQIRDKGQLDLRDSPNQYLPWFDIKQTYPDRAPITIRGILTHSSGLPRESDFPYWTGPNFEFPSREQIMESVGKQQTLYPGDTYWQYSNLGLTLAGMMIAEVSGQTYDAYVTEHILDPLGLSDTQPELPRAHWGERLAIGYSGLQRNGKRMKLPFFQTRGIAPAAGFSSTVEDLAAFAAWQFRLLETGDEEVLRANTLREMHRVHWLDPDWKIAWGLGFRVSRNGDTTFVGHGGHCPGYRTQLQLQTDSKIAVIVMANVSGFNVEQYTEQIFEIVEPAITRALKSNDGRSFLDPSLDVYTGTYSRVPSWGLETAILHWNGGLAMLSLPSNDPLEVLEELHRTDKHRFRRVREDGQLGEEILFELDTDGSVTAFRRHSNVSFKLD